MIEIDNISFSYERGASRWPKSKSAGGDGRATLFQLRDVTLRVSRGERLGIIGPSGSGKSTLLKIIGGHLQMDSGTIRLDGKDISSLEPGLRDIITVFQDLALFPHLTAYENVEFPLTVGGRMKRQDRPALVKEYMKRFGIWDLRDSKPDDLSGGERQRTALARALIAKPSVLLLDEPTASLDLVQKNELALLLNESSEWPVTPAIIIVTHDYEFALSLCDRLTILKGGAVVATGNTKEVVSRPPNAAAAEVLNNHNIVYGLLDDSRVFRSKEGNISALITDQLSIGEDNECALLIRADVLHLVPHCDAERICFDGIVEAIQYRGVYTRIVVNVNGLHLYCDIARPVEPPPLQLRQKVKVGFTQKDARLVSAGSVIQAPIIGGTLPKEALYAS
jgi:ABC-type Fe3+/spermidine/putrescine transport system ATPase subunit